MPNSLLTEVHSDLRAAQMNDLVTIVVNVLARAIISRTERRMGTAI